MFPLIGSLVGAGASLLGNFLSSQSQAENTAATNAANQQINQQNIAQAQAAAALGSTQFDRSLDWQQTQFGIQQQNRLSDYYTSEARRAQDIQLQKDFAQMGVRWKVADAIAAGLHPLYALGASGISYASPAGYSGGSVGGFSGPGASHSPIASSIPHQSAGDTSIGRGLSAAGQDIGRAIAATRTLDEQMFSKIQLERGALENELLRSKIAQTNAAGNGKSLPTSSDPFQQGVLSSDAPTPRSGSVVQDDKFKRIAGPEGQPGSEPAAITDVGYARTATGWAPIPSKDVKERIEDNWAQEILHAVRNNILPTIGINRQPPPFSPPAGQYWSFNPYRQEYQLRNMRVRDNSPHYSNSSVRGGESFIGAP